MKTFWVHILLKTSWVHSECWGVLFNLALIPCPPHGLGKPLYSLNCEVRRLKQFLFFAASWLLSTQIILRWALSFLVQCFVEYAIMENVYSIYVVDCLFKLFFTINQIMFSFCTCDDFWQSLMLIFNNYVVYWMYIKGKGRHVLKLLLRTLVIQVHFNFNKVLENHETVMLRTLLFFLLIRS